jgi:hypothetical protein
MIERERFFYEHAGYSFDPKTETAEDGRARAARQLAAAETWAERVGVEYRWEDDWGIGSHREFFGEGSAYEDREPETCEAVVAYLSGRAVGSLGCIDDADANYRRLIEAEIASEAMFAELNGPTLEAVR